MLAAPVWDSEDNVFAVIELRNKSNGEVFSAHDQEDLAEVAKSLGVLVESWWRMGCGCRQGAVGRSVACFPQITSCH